MASLAAYLTQVRQLARRASQVQAPRRLAKYRDDPLGYARDVLRVRPWATQARIAQLLRTPPYRVLVKSSHSVGKTWTGAWLTSHWFDTGEPGTVAITTAPTHRDVCDLLWTEIRAQRRRAGLGGFVGDAAPLLYAAPDHFAKGFTAERGESFQGRHFARMLFVLDEAVGVDSVFWQTVKTMFKPDGRHGVVAFFNPTDTASEAYQQELGGGWHVVQMSALDHPNLAPETLAAHRRGEPLPYPAAVDRSQFEDWLAEWAEPLPVGDATATDVEWPPGSGVWHRPGPLMESRALGRWPSQATYGVWSDALWLAATRRDPRLTFPAGRLPVVGCDPARFGDNYTAIHWRWDGTSLGHERHNGWGLDQTAGRLKELCRELAALVNEHRPPQAEPVRPEEIPVNVDVNGLGSGVVDMRGEFRFVPVDALGASSNPAEFPNVRSELWFGTAARARKGGIDLSRIERGHLACLRQQAMAVRWKVNAAGQKQVERKEETQKRLGRGSPDDLDGMNLSYFEPPSGGVSVSVSPKGAARPGPGSAQARRGMFGRGGR